MRLLASLVFISAIAVAQHEKDGEKGKHPFIGDLKAIAAGQELFADGCAVCHGTTGEGGRGPNLRERVMWHPVDEQAIYKAVKNGLGGAMPATNLPEDKLWQITAFVVSLTAPAIETNVAGDRAAGQQVFEGKGGCTKCHAVAGKGSKFGPDLSNIASVRPVPNLRDAIVDPNADGAYTYRAVTATLKSGRVMKGVARNRTNYSLQLQDNEGNLHLLDVGEITALTIGKESPMPKDYSKRLTKQEIENLVAYLARLSVRTDIAAK